jgi:polysaccharide export outer membrane protein
MSWKHKSTVALFALGLVCAAYSQQAKSGDAGTASAPKPANDSYIIGADDVLTINVWHEPEMSRDVPVRPDGKISLPLGGEFQAAGLTASQLEDAMKGKLQTLVQNPQITVILKEVRSHKFSIMGEVNRPGTYPLSGKTTVLEAIATAGGLRDFAKTKKMYILRRMPDGTTKQVKVNYKELLNGKIDEDTMSLQARDTVVVP